MTFGRQAWRGMTALMLLAAGCRRSPPQGIDATIAARTLGLVYLEENRLAEAEREFKKVTDLAPDDLAGPSNLAHVYLRMGRFQDALASIRRAIAIDSTNLDSRLILAKTYQLIGQVDQARVELNRLAPSGDPRILYALVELSRGATDSLSRSRYRDLLTKLVAAAPGNQPAHLELAQALALAGDADGALRELEALRQLPPAPPPEAGQFLTQAIRALGAGRTAAAKEPLERLERFLSSTPAFLTGLEAIRGPEGTIAGIPRLTLPTEYALRRVIGRDTTPIPVTFVEATTAAGLTAPTPAAAPATVAFGGDLLYSAGPGTTRLWRQTEGVWTDVAATVGIAPDAVIAATFADLDNDGRLDLYLVDDHDRGHLYLRTATGTFRDVAGPAGLANPGLARRVVAADLDHDGDLDLFVASEQGNRFFQNDGNGTFREITEEAGLTGAPHGRDAAVVDFDGDGLLDLLVTSEGGLHLYHNTGDRRFEDRTGPSGLPSSTGGVVAAADYDNDGFADLLLGGDDRTAAALYRNRGDGTFARDSRMPPPGFVPEVAAFLDYDNDGHLDLFLAGRPSGSGRRAVTLLRNEGAGRMVDRSSILPSETTGALAAVAADLGGDRDIDLLVADRAGFHFLRNEGGNLNLAIEVRLTGLRTGSGKNNDFGIGSRLELRAGDLYQMRTVTEPVTLLGIGRHLKADVLRIEWPNGVPQTLHYPGSDQDVVEQQVLKSSCAFLYAWDGRRFNFVTDAMWRSALGMPIGIGGGGHASYAPSGASREYLRIPPDAIAPRDGRYRVQWTEELWETSYTDQLELVAVDHPDSIDVLVNERFVPPGAAVTLDLVQSTGRRPPVSAIDDQGNDVLPLLAASDDRYVANLTPTRYQGVVEPHDLVLDLGRSRSDAPMLLLLRGWIFPTDASINVALSQGGDLAVRPPLLEVRDGHGRWQPAIADLGFPSGKAKTVIADLTGKFPTPDHHVRIRTNLQIYWDQAEVVTPISGTPVRVTRLTPVAADLHYRGFSRTYRRGGRYGPHWFDYQKVSTDPIWRPIAGRFTRYGDVGPLLLSDDDRYVVMGPGDEMTVDFDAAVPPSLPSGWRRDYFFHSVGWIKDADLNTAHGGTVDPLPFHAMTTYPYDGTGGYPDDSAHRHFLERYQTRPGRAFGPRSR